MKVLPRRFKSSFSLMSLPINEISLLKIMKREGNINLLVIGQGIIHEFFAIFCHICIAEHRLE